MRRVQAIVSQNFIDQVKEKKYTYSEVYKSGLSSFDCEVPLMQFINSTEEVRKIDFFTTTIDPVRKVKEILYSGLSKLINANNIK